LYELAEERFAIVEAAAQKLVAENPKYQQLLIAIDEDFTAGGKRLGEALTRYNNTYMPIVEQYFPMHRQAAVSARTADAELARDLMGSSNGAFKIFVEKGFTNKRVEIPAQYQTAIRLDIMGVWAEAVNKEEHFMAYGQLVKDLNAIYKQSRPVIDAIQRRYGKQAVDYINKYINALANPSGEKTRTALDNFVKKLRGNTAAAYLGWKTSSIVLQAITSPAPFLAYMNPVEYWGMYIDYVTHQKQRWQEIIELSPHMKHRSANLMVELIKAQAKEKFNNKVENAINKFNERGIKGLELIDQISVAPGWMVLYKKEKNRLTKDTTNANLSERDIEVKAAQYADDIVRQTQPSGRADDLSPLFRNQSELGKAVLQFTQSLNVIWQNIRYDLPQMVRERRYQSAAGTVIGYAMAGLMLGLVIDGFDDDDDWEARLKKVAFWSATQFTDAFPIIGSAATNYAEQLITGTKRYRSSFNIFPTLDIAVQALSTATKGIQDKDQERLIKAGVQAMEAFFMTKGLPVSGTKEAGRLFGIGDGDGELGFNPGALLGRR
jgi:hypothetical protein